MGATLPNTDVTKNSKAEARVFAVNLLRKTRPNLSETEPNRTSDALLNQAYGSPQQQQDVQLHQKNENSKNTPRKWDRFLYPVSKAAPLSKSIIYHLNQGPTYGVSQEYPERMLWTIHNLCCEQKHEKSKKKSAKRKRRSMLDDYQQKKIQKFIQAGDSKNAE